MKNILLLLLVFTSSSKVLAQYNDNSAQLTFYGASDFKIGEPQDFTKKYYAGGELRYLRHLNGKGFKISNGIASQRLFSTKYALGVYLAYEAKGMDTARLYFSIDSTKIDDSFNIYKTGGRSYGSNVFFGPSFSFMKLNSFVSIVTTLSGGIMHYKKSAIYGSYTPSDTLVYKNKLIGVGRDGGNLGYFGNLSLSVVFHFDDNFGLTLNYGVTYYNTIVKANYYEEYNQPFFVTPAITPYTQKLEAVRQQAGIGVYFNF